MEPSDRLPWEHGEMLWSEKTQSLVCQRCGLNIWRAMKERTCTPPETDEEGSAQ